MEASGGSVVMVEAAVGVGKVDEGEGDDGMIVGRQREAGFVTRKPQMSPRRRGRAVVESSVLCTLG